MTPTFGDRVRNRRASEDELVPVAFSYAGLKFVAVTSSTNSVKEMMMAPVSMGNPSAKYTLPSLDNSVPNSTKSLLVLLYY